MLEKYALFGVCLELMLETSELSSESPSPDLEAATLSGVISPTAGSRYIIF
jgi:hypothetical protein